MNKREPFDVPPELQSQLDNTKSIKEQMKILDRWQRKEQDRLRKIERNAKSWVVD